MQSARERLATGGDLFADPVLREMSLVEFLCSFGAVAPGGQKQRPGGRARKVDNESWRLRFNAFFGRKLLPPQQIVSVLDAVTDCQWHLNPELVLLALSLDRRRWKTRMRCCASAAWRPTRKSPRRVRGCAAGGLRNASCELATPSEELSPTPETPNHQNAM